MKKAGIILLLLITQFYMLPYRALYIYCAANHVSIATVNNESQDQQNQTDIAKITHHNGSDIGTTHPPKHNDRFANTLSALTISYTETCFQEVLIQEILLAKQQHTCIEPLILPNSSRGSPLV